MPVILDAKVKLYLLDCGADHTSLVREELESRAVGDDRQPIEDECEKWRKEQGQYLRSEDNDWQEWKTLD